MNEPCPQCGQPTRPNQAPGACPACLVRLAMGEIADVTRGPVDRALQDIGPYRLLHELGEGGFGTVYAAEQIEPVQRMVAVKVLKLGMDSKQVVARFQLEQQALAALDHPNIAQLLDAGMTETGRPYFVMELIDGVPLTEYCDAHRLSVRERIEVFLPVCHAIAHAHQQGILHRDLKASNIMVAESQGKPVPKVIDFGIAKAIGDQAAQSTLLTQEQQFIGTPAAMSPEQAGGERSIDARADVYALGVLLYQLLTGQTPLDESATSETSHHELLRLIRENDASRPSMRVKKLSADRQAKTAERRSERPDTLARLIEGDLDCITSKALFRDRERRYPTPLHLAEDLERHLQHRVIEARPPTFGYVVKRFARRHTVACVAGGLAGVGIIGAGIAILNLSAAAQRQAKRSEASVHSLVDILFTKSSWNGYRSDYTVRDLIIDSEREIRERLAPFPDLEARALGRLGHALVEDGELKRAIPILERACDLAEAEFGKVSPEWLLPATQLAHAQKRSMNFDEAVAYGKGAYEVSLALYGADSLGTIRAMANYAIYRWQRGSTPEGVSDLEKAAALCESRSEPEAKEELAKICNHLFRTAMWYKQFEQAERYARKRLQVVSQLENPESVDIEQGRVMLAAALREQERFEEAEVALNEALEAAIDWHGRESSFAVDTQLEQVKLYRKWRRLDDAESIARATLELARKIESTDPKLVGWASDALKRVQAEQEEAGAATAD